MRGRINWWVPSWTVAGTAAILLSLAVYSAYGALLYMVLIGPFFCLIGLVLLVVAAIRKQHRQLLSLLVALVAFLGVSGGLLKYNEALRARLRWLLWSSNYKAEVLVQPVPANGEFRHVEWEASGFAGVAIDTVYVVFDPKDSLAVAARSHAKGKFEGIPCEVPVVRRLESHWYSVWFYSNEVWGVRNSLDCSGEGE